MMTTDERLQKAYALRTSIIELGAWLSIWRDDVASNLKPTETSIEKATAVYERALSEVAELGAR